MQPDTLVAEGAAQYIEQYEKFQNDYFRDEPEWLNDQRKYNLARFSKIGFPTQRDEDWRYTPLRSITSKPYLINDGQESKLDVSSLKIPDLESYQIVIVDGVIDETSFSENKNLEEIKVESFSSISKNNPESIKSILGSIAEKNNHGFTALNHVFSREGVVITLGKNVVLEKPIEILSVSHADMTMVNLRNLVIAEKGSGAKIIERYVSVGDGTTLTNSTTEFSVESGAEIDYYLVQTQSWTANQVCGTWVRQQADSRFSCHSITLGGALVRNDLCTELSGLNAHCDMYGIYSLSGKQHVDNHTTMIHQVENCTSNEVYKGVLDQRSRGVFHGRIKVAQDAQKTNAHQSSNTLLLSRDAEIDTKPQLEIYADDVKCSHGATIGQIDEDSLFYLRTRGIDEAQSRSMLTYAFVADVLNKVEIEPLRKYLELELSSQLLVQE